MSWRDDLRRVRMSDGRNLIAASFRGVPFFVESSELSGGRRAVVHEFPLREKPFVEDIGKRARSFRIDGYVLGADYLAQRDALIAALDGSENPGQLIHPYYGELVAVGEQYTVHETKTEGGIAMVSITFAEAPDQTPAPVAVVDSVDQVSTGADAARAASRAELVAAYSSAGLPAFALASAETALQNALAALKAKLAPVVADTQELAQMTGTIALMTAEASSLVRTPDILFDNFAGVLDALVNTAEAAPGAMLTALNDTYAADLGPLVAGTTSTRVTEATNQAALTGALRRVVAIQAAKLAPLVPYLTIDDALAARDEVAAMLDEQAQTASDTAYPALVDLRSQVLRAVPGGQAFASVVTVTRKVPVPSLVLAYQLYGSVDLEADVIARNDVPHPGFVVGELKVLSSDGG